MIKNILPCLKRTNCKFWMGFWWLKNTLFTGVSRVFRLFEFFADPISCGRYIQKSAIYCGFFLPVPPILWLFNGGCWLFVGFNTHLPHMFNKANKTNKTNTTRSDV